MIREGFAVVSDCHINNEGRLKIDFPPSLETKSGLIAVLSNNELCYLGATSHFGPRIRDFMFAKTGSTNSAKIHQNIIKEIVAGKKVTLLTKDNSHPYEEKANLLKKLKPLWNGREPSKSPEL